MFCHLFECPSIRIEGDCKFQAFIAHAIQNHISLRLASQEVKTTPPRFTQPLTDTSATDGDELILNAVVTGFPIPHIWWFHNNENIDKSEDFVLNFDRNTGRCECVIVECLPDDQGTFRYKVLTFNVCSINLCCGRDAVLYPHSITIIMQ